MPLEIVEVLTYMYSDVSLQVDMPVAWYCSGTSSPLRAFGSGLVVPGFRSVKFRLPVEEDLGLVQLACWLGALEGLGRI